MIAENYPKFFREPWNKEKVDVTIQWWPHWGSKALSELVGVSNQQMISKAQHLKLKILPKNERLCFQCKEKFQKDRRYGLLCRDCGLSHRKEVRSLIPKSREKWIGDLLRTLRYRSKEESDLSVEYLAKLWDLQKGKCAYSGLELREPLFYGRGRDFLSASMDRIDSNKGYAKGNVAWCCWACNIAKQDFFVQDYIQLCKTIADRAPEIHSQLTSLQQLSE